jgi:hypothetical protein
VAVHVVAVHGETASEWYVAIDAAGHGRRYESGERPPGPVRELSFSVNASPARDRFMRLHRDVQDQLAEASRILQAGGPPLNPIALRRSAFVGNVVEAIRHTGPEEPQPVLQQLGRYGWGSAEKPWELGADTAEELDRLGERAREEGQLDAWASAAVLVAVVLPQCVAAHASSDAHVELGRYFVFSIAEMRVSAWQAIYGPVHKALREGYAAAVLATAWQLLARAEGQRDAALCGAADRDAFSEQLFLGAPAALAATLLAKMADEAGVSDTGKLRTRADELHARMQDGILHQWLDFDDARLQQERRDILAAQRRGDTLEVNLALRRGEDGLRRPRSVRDLLLGNMPWPTFTEEPNE